MAKHNIGLCAVLSSVLTVSLNIIGLGVAPIQAEPMVVRLTPPRLELITLNSADCANSEGRIAAFCDRPCRTEGIRIELEQLGKIDFASKTDFETKTGSENKTVIHCYGHGEYGISTFFGSVQLALELLMKTNPDLNTPIRVIGAGCVGLTMALELKRRGFTKVSISTKEKYGIPSWRAGGFFVPGTGNETIVADKTRAQAGMGTYLFFRAAQTGKNPYVTSDIVHWLPVYCPADEQCEVEILAHLGLVPQAELVTLDFGNGVIHTGYKRHWSYFIDVVELMTQLWACVERADIPVIYEQISSFADCSESIICNCTGAEAAQLSDDNALIPTRGHFFMLQVADNWFEPGMDYMINTHVVQDGKKELLYFFPKPRFVVSSLAIDSGERNMSEQSTRECDMHECAACDQLVCAGMIGGTLVPRRECDAAGRDAQEFAKLEARARQFFYGQA